MNDLWFVTFGDTRLSEARNRIRRQAQKMGVFGDRIRICSTDDLDADFRDRLRDQLLPGTKGFGYWSWKPQVILQTMREMPEGDVLLYCDLGCHFNVKGLKRLEEYRMLAIDHGIVAFQARPFGEDAKSNFRLHFLPERQWTKMDLLQHFGFADRRDVLDSGQVGATMVIVHNDVATRSIIEEWRNFFYDHFELVDDSPSKIPNSKDFIENRYDQSALSLLCKKNYALLLSCGEYVHIRPYMPDGEDESLWPEYWNEMSQFPVHGRRDLGKYTKFVECPDWLKPIIGKRGRRIMSRIYETLKPILKLR